MLLLRDCLSTFEITRKVCRKSCLNKKRIQKTLSEKFSEKRQQSKSISSCKKMRNDDTYGGIKECLMMRVFVSVFAYIYFLYKIYLLREAI